MARCVCLLIAMAAAAPAGGADPTPPVQLVDDFEDVQNALGGYRNPFQRSPSRVEASRVAKSAGDRGAAEGRCLRIHATRAPEGFCGYWLHLFDFKDAEKRYFDSRPFRFLSFWVKGERGKETFLVKLADRRWIERDDSVAIGAVTEFLEGGVTTQWREVLIPLTQLPKLDRRELGGLTIEFDTPGDQVVYLDDVSFKTVPRAVLPPTEHRPVVRDGDQVPRKLWVWKTDSLLLDEHAGDQLLDFCSQQQIDEIWMQLLYAFDTPAKPVDTANPTLAIRYPDAWRAFLRRAHAAGVRVHALDGAAHLSQRAHHWIPLAVVDGLIDFNRRGVATERFDGVHFDNEPYLLLGWIDPVLREQILLEFLELNAECQRRVREGSEMKFGIDIPFWWQETDAATGRPIGEVTFQGRRQAASYHCIEMLDNVGVMNYRDTADGADGMLAHGRGLLAFADQVEGATLLMGAETFQSPPTPVCFAVGLPREAFFKTLRDPASTLTRDYMLRGFRLRTFDDGTHVHVGIEIPAGSRSARRHDAQFALLQLARQMGSGRQEGGVPADVLARVADVLREDAEWSGLQAIHIKDPASDQTYPGFLVSHSMLSKITFADDGFSHFATEVGSAEKYFGRYKSFGGMAVHYYETFRNMIAAEGTDELEQTETSP